MKTKYYSLITLFASSLCFSECLVPVNKELLVLVEDARGTYYALPKEHVEFVLANPNHCINTQLSSTQAETTKLLSATLAEYKAMTDKMEADLLEYKRVNRDLQTTLEQSVSLTSKFDGLVTEYDDLSEEYSTLANRYDDLAEQYRDIAISTNGLFTVDAGVGLDTDSNPIGLLGVGYKNLNLWGITREGNTGIVIGTSVPF